MVKLTKQQEFLIYEYRNILIDLKTECEKDCNFNELIADTIDFNRDIDETIRDLEELIETN